jgi:hypothetical protein
VAATPHTPYEDGGQIDAKMLIESLKESMQDIEITYKDTKGNTITEEEYKRLTTEEPKQVETPKVQEPTLQLE